MATHHATSYIDQVNQKIQQEQLFFWRARVEAVKLGHWLCGFARLGMDTPIFGASCLCGQMAFVDVQDGEVFGPAVTEPCPCKDRWWGVVQ